MENTQNYLVVLFKNKTKRKIINKFKTHKKSLDFYKKLVLESDSVIFPKLHENGYLCKFEIALLEKNNGKMDSIYVKDELGRQIKIELDNQDYKITKIQEYNIEEEFVDYKTKKKITSHDFIKTYLNSDGLKLVSKLNNKIVFQNDENFNLFTLKNIDDADRFIECLSTFFRNEKRTDCLFVKDYSTYQRKFLYDLLIKKGFSKTYLQRHSTTHPSKK